MEDKKPDTNLPTPDIYTHPYQIDCPTCKEPLFYSSKKIMLTDTVQAGISLLVHVNTLKPVLLTDYCSCSHCGGQLDLFAICMSQKKREK